MNNSHYRRSFVKVMDDITNSMPGISEGAALVITIFKVTGTGPYILYVDDMYYAAVNKVITIQGNKYTITALSDVPGNNQITVTGSVAPVAGTFNLYPFYFYHGIPVDAASERVGQNATDIFPLIWLREPFTSKTYWADHESRDQVATVELYFLDEADPNVLQTDPRWISFVNPLLKLQDYFWHYAKEVRQDLYTWEQTTDDTPLNKFGVNIVSKGSVQAMFADNLSGIKSAGSFTIFKNAQDFRNPL